MFDDLFMHRLNFLHELISAGVGIGSIGVDQRALLAVCSLDHVHDGIVCGVALALKSIEVYHRHFTGSVELVFSARVETLFFHLKAVYVTIFNHLIHACGERVHEGGFVVCLIILLLQHGDTV